ncbi:MAG: hypothetical protein HYX72_14365 [Acidobacteria bacterium]|nr:hypothetical protein [Acidobacteriota bacterium]
MANTWTVYAQGISFAAGKNMLAILNGGARVLRIRRMGFLNNQTVAVTGVVCLGEIRRYSAAGLTGQTNVPAIAHDSTNSALQTVTVGTGGTPAGTSELLRRYLWSSDEPAVSGATVDELECLVPLNVLWDAGYGDANVQPLTIRQNEMLCLFNTVGAAGLVDVWIEFTDEAA